MPALLIVEDKASAIPFNARMLPGYLWIRDHETASIIAPNAERKSVHGDYASLAVGMKHEMDSLLRPGIYGHVARLPWNASHQQHSLSKLYDSARDGEPDWT